MAVHLLPQCASACGPALQASSTAARHLRRLNMRRCDHRWRAPDDHEADSVFILFPCMHCVHGKKGGHIEPVRHALVRRALAHEADAARGLGVCNERQRALGHHLHGVEVQVAVHEEQVALCHAKVVHQLRRLRAQSAASRTRSWRCPTRAMPVESTVSIN